MTAPAGETAALDVQILARLTKVRLAIGQAARNAGRSPDAVTLVAVSKYKPQAAIAAAYRAGQRDFGENYVQELIDKAHACRKAKLDVRWHFIGSLQRNKVAKLVRVVDVIHSIDSFALAEAVSRAVVTQKRGPVGVLLQVNLGQESQKGGVAPDDVVALGQRVSDLAGLRLWGLMAVPPAPAVLADAADAEDAPEALTEGYFKALQALVQQLDGACGGGTGKALSMGMSHDFASAIGAGATLVRIGTAVFGARA